MKMKYLVIIIGALLVIMILYKMFTFNMLSGGGKRNYTYLRYNWSLNQERANSIIEYWNADSKREFFVRKLMFFDFLFVIVYVILLCHISYSSLQQQNRLWLNIWLRMGIFSIIIGAGLNLVQDYFNFLSLDRGKSYYFVLVITLVKWVFVFLAVIPIVLNFFLRPMKTIK